MALEALIFDCDGTLAETEEAHREAFNRVFAENDLDWHWSIETYGRLLEVTGGKERLRHFVRNDHPSKGQLYIDNDQLIADMHVRKTAIYMELVRTGEVPLRPGVERLIREARASGMRLAISTTTNMEPLTALFEGTLGVEALTWFEAIAAGDMVRDKKPAPDVYELALQKLNLEGAQCLALEDTTNGIVSARAAGIPVLVTVSEYSKGQDFGGAIAVVEHLGEPDSPTRLASGEPVPGGIVDLSVLQDWHKAARS